MSMNTDTAGQGPRLFSPQRLRLSPTLTLVVTGAQGQPGARLKFHPAADACKRSVQVASQWAGGRSQSIGVRHTLPNA